MNASGAAPFGALLRRFRLAAGLSQEALAEQARISAEAIGALERGIRKTPQRQTLALLVEALTLHGDERAAFEAAARRGSRPRSRPSSDGREAPVPSALTSFVGREAEIIQLQAHLTTHRLVTVVGPGGVGKSRLAVELARIVASRFGDCLHLAELTAVRDATLLASAIAAAAALREQPGVPLERTLALGLRGGPRLLILDNCEHLAGPIATLVTDLLAETPELRVLATSREPLRILGETVFRLDPLPLGGHAGAPSPAGRLFLDRVAAIAPELLVDPDRRALETIVRRLDGIPLAIELAAARAGAMSIPEIADRLDRRFRLLTLGPRTATVHHRTLRALFDWSFDLLDEAERTLFRRLAVFSGSWTMASAEAVAGEEAATVLDCITRLYDKSLVIADRGRPTRYRYLQTIHEYAAERLAEAGEREQTSLRHARYFLGIAAAAEPRLHSVGQDACVATIKADLDNIRAALDASASIPELRESALAAIAAMARFWLITGSFSEARIRLDTELGRAHAPSRPLVIALCNAAYVALNERCYEDGCGVGEDDGEDPACRTGLGAIRRRAVQYAKAFARRATEAAGEIDDGWARTYATLVSLNAHVFDLDPAIDEALIAARERVRERDDPWLMGHAVWPLGIRAMARGDIAAARTLLEEALALAERSGDRLALAATAVTLGRMLVGTDPARAAEVIALGAMSLDPGNIVWLTACLDASIEVALALGRGRDGARFYGAAEAMRRRIVVEITPASPRNLRDAVLAAVGEGDLQLFAGEGTSGDFAGAIEAIRSFANELTRSAPAKTGSKTQPIPCTNAVPRREARPPFAASTPAEAGRTREPRPR